VAPDRVGAFAALHEQQNIELVLFGGRSHHATGAVDDPGVPHDHVHQRDVYRLAASGHYRAVICGTAGRIALPAAWRGARRARVPFLLWSALWSHPRTVAHRLAGAPLLRRIYLDADAVITYGPHVTEFVVAHGAQAIAEAPQSVDGGFWSSAADAPRRLAPFTALSVGRAARYKGEPELLAAWAQSGLAPPAAALGLVGERSGDGGRLPAGVLALGAATPEQLRNLYAGSDVLVMAAIETRHAKEPWGLVANEAMSQGIPVIATDAVGAAAGGLVRDGQTGLVVPARDPIALANALTRLAGDESLRQKLGAQARAHVAAYTQEAWATGVTHGLRLAGAARDPAPPAA
jgi:glycosyltransferase involved in cell wall biosynthesis